MDLHMPKLDGFRAAEIIRSGGAGKKNTNIPIVAVTATVLEEDLAGCEQVGINSYLIKPVQYDQLHLMVNKFLPKKQLLTSVSAPISIATGSKNIFDKEFALKNLADDDSIFRDALLLFMKKMPEYIQKLQDAIACADVKQIAVWAHTFKGAARTIGAIELGDILEAIERDAHNEITSTDNHSIIEKAVSVFQNEVDFTLKSYS
jgi:CheY-like chemotaxis protein